MDVLQVISGALLALCGAFYLFGPDRHFQVGHRQASRSLRIVTGVVMGLFGLLSVVIGLT